MKKASKSTFSLLKKIIKHTLRGEMYVVEKHNEDVDWLIEGEYVNIIEQLSLYEDVDASNLHLMATDRGIELYIEELCDEA
jgi:hypothetical protein